MFSSPDMYATSKSNEDLRIGLEVVRSLRVALGGFDNGGIWKKKHVLTFL